MSRLGTLALFLCFWCLCLEPVVGQESVHQRLSVEMERRHGIEASLGFSWRAAGLAWEGEGLATLEYAWKRSLSFSLSLPAICECDGNGPRNGLDFRPGDPAVSISYQWRSPESRVQAGLGYSMPLMAGDEARFHRFSLKLGFAAIRDPAVLAVDASISSGLPRETKGCLLWPAFSAGLSLYCWELLNDRVGVRAGLEPALSLGILRLGSGAWPSPIFSLAFSFAVSWDEAGWGAQVGWRGGGQSGLPELDATGYVRKEW
jgi:hypothetical protein